MSLKLVLKKEKVKRKSLFNNPKPLVAAQNVKKFRTQPKTNIFYTIFVRQTCGGLVEMARLRLDSALGFKKDWLWGICFLKENSTDLEETYPHNNNLCFSTNILRGHHKDHVSFGA